MFQVFDDPEGFIDGILWVYEVGGTLAVIFTVVALTMFIVAKPTDQEKKGE